jgi:hypothetical protein
LSEDASVLRTDACNGIGLLARVEGAEARIAIGQTIITALVDLNVALKTSTVRQNSRRVFEVAS